MHMFKESCLCFFGSRQSADFTACSSNCNNLKNDGAMNKIAVGQRVEGKTTLGMWDLRQRHRGVVAWDPRGMIEGIIVYSPEELQEAMRRNGEEEDELSILPIVYRFDSTDPDREFQVFCSVVFPPNFTVGGFGVLIDEAGQLQGANSINPDLARAIKQHPTKPPEEAITIFQTMHTLGESWAKGRSLIDEYYIFRLTAPSDLRAIEEFTGKPELVEIIINLPPHHCVKYFNSRRPAGQPEYIVMDNPEMWHVPVTTLDEKRLDKNVAWRSNGPVQVL